MEALTLALTPSADFFCRNHHAYPSPALVGPGQLLVDDHIWTLEQLQALPQISRVVTLECAGNGRTLFEPLPPGTGWGTRAVSTAKFAGTRLLDLLKATEQLDSAHVHFTGQEGDYQRSLTLEEIHSTDPLLAWLMNDLPLPHEHGGPIRLVVPGHYAMTSIKWLGSIRSCEHESSNYYQQQDYIFKPLNGPQRRVNWMRAKSRISQIIDRAGQVHLPEQEVTVTGPCTVEGFAWGGRSPVESVWLEIEGQKFPAQLTSDQGPSAWRGFFATLDLAAGQYRLTSRCRLSDGEEQPLQAPWNQQGYENNSCLYTQLNIQPH